MAIIVKEAKAQIEFRLARDVKGTKENCYCFIDGTRLTKENVGALLNGADGTETADTDHSWSPPPSLSSAAHSARPLHSVMGVKDKRGYQVGMFISKKQEKNPLLIDSDCKHEQ